MGQKTLFYRLRDGRKFFYYGPFSFNFIFHNLKLNLGELDNKRFKLKKKVLGIINFIFYNFKLNLIKLDNRMIKLRKNKIKI